MDVWRAAPLLLALTPVGPGWLVNSYTTDDQARPSLATDAAGGFVVVWQSSGQDGSGWGVFGQRHDAAGGATGTEFRVNTNTLGHQAYPRVGSASGGEFVVVWDSFGQDGSSFGVFGQRYHASGQDNGAEFRVNTHTPQSQSNPAAGWSAGGRSVVVWQSENQDGSLFGIFGQAFDAVGGKSGAEFQVNAYTTGEQAYPAVTAGPAGAFAVVWEDSSRDGSGRGVFGRVFDAGGEAVGEDFRVNTFTAGTQAAPAVAWTGPAGFVVVWHGAGQDGSSLGVFGQRFDAAGATAGSEFTVNSSTLGAQGLPAVAADETGAFVVVWVSSGYDGSGAGVFARRYDAQGEPAGPEFVVNADTGAPVFPAVGAAGDSFVVAWQSLERDGSGDGVLAQRVGGDRIFADGFE
jgi:hypothetical protein